MGKRSRRTRERDLVMEAEFVAMQLWPKRGLEPSELGSIEKLEKVRN